MLMPEILRSKSFYKATGEPWFSELVFIYSSYPLYLGWKKDVYTSSHPQDLKLNHLTMASLFLKMACRWVPRMTELLAVSLDSEEEKDSCISRCK